MSKVGTKHAVLHFTPEQYLLNFGEDSELSDADAALAEEYLLKVSAGVRSTTTCKTFDELRLEKYIGGNTGVNICSCGGKCDKTRCSYKDKTVKCIVFCHGKQDNPSCRNK